MKILLQCVHALSVLAAAFLGGAVLYFVLGSVGLRVASSDAVVEWGMIVLPFLQLALAVWGIWKKVPYWAVLPVIGLCGGFVLYLIWDDPVRPPSPEIGPIGPTDAKNYAVYRWFVKDDPQNRLAEQDRMVKELPVFPTDRTKWPEFFSQHREAITQAWEKDILGRDWVEGMAQHAPEGIYPLPRTIGGGMLAFSPLKNSFRARWGNAHLLLIDQRYDDASRVLLPGLRASYNLERGGAQFTSEMIATVCIRGSYDLLETLTDSGKLSREVRTEIVEALKEAPHPQLIFRNAFLGEQVFIHVSHEEMKKDYCTVAKSIASAESAKITGHRLLWRLFFNPNRGEREYIDFLHESCRLAEQRQLEAGDKLNQEFVRQIGETRLKNPVGQLLMIMTAPAFGKVTTSIWETEDRRLALLKRLETP